MKTSAETSSPSKTSPKNKRPDTAFWTSIPLTELVQQAKASATYAAESVNKPAKMTSEYDFNLPPKVQTRHTNSGNFLFAGGNARSVTMGEFTHWDQWNGLEIGQGVYHNCY